MLAPKKKGGGGQFQLEFWSQLTVRLNMPVRLENPVRMYKHNIKEIIINTIPPLLSF